MKSWPFMAFKVWYKGKLKKWLKGVTSSAFFLLKGSAWETGRSPKVINLDIRGTDVA